MSCVYGLLFVLLCMLSSSSVNGDVLFFGMCVCVVFLMWKLSLILDFRFV